MPSRVHTSGKERTYPHLLQDRKHGIQWGSSAKQAGEARVPSAGCIRQEKDRRRNAQRIHFVHLSGRSNTRVQGPYSTETREAGRSEIGAAWGNQGPAQSQLPHRAAISTKHERADPLTQIGHSLETDRQFTSNYTLLEISWDRPRQVVQGKGENTHNFPRRLNSDNSIQDAVEVVTLSQLAIGESSPTNEPSVVKDQVQ